jgi:ribosomal protein S18 acetylase RimI-like enzyme
MTAFATFQAIFSLLWLIDCSGLRKSILETRISSIKVQATFRNVQPEDLRAIAGLCVDVFEGPFQWFESMKRQVSIESMASELHDRYYRFIKGNKKHSMIVAVEKDGNNKDEIAAFLEVGTLPSPVMVNSTWEGQSIETRPEVLFLGNVAVKQQYRRRGIGSKLVKIGCKVAEKFQEPALFAAVEADNAGALSMYEQAGFQIVLDERDLIDAPKRKQGGPRVYVKVDIHVPSISKDVAQENNMAQVDESFS